MTVNAAGYHDPLRAVVIGAGGGIGGALLTRLESDTRVDAVFGFARDPRRIDTSKAHTGAIDVLDENSIAAAAAQATADGPLDIVIVATGILHRDTLQPEKSLRELAATSMADVFAVNTIGPALVAKHFLPTLRRGHKTVFAALSARVGSIGDNRLGGWTSYRASKAALNQILKTLSIEQFRRRPESIVVGLHPGTVDTGLSKPFQKRVPDNKLFTPEASAAYLLNVLDELDTKDSGQVFAWDGSPIPN
ncbi:MAG: SDR family NAD(P)-dependent oxidoreductase [Pseudomonadota bacterium]